MCAILIADEGPNKIVESSIIRRKTCMPTVIIAKNKIARHIKRSNKRSNQSLCIELPTS